MGWIDKIILGMLDLYGSNDPYELCDEIGINIIKLEPKSLILHEDYSVYIREYKGKEFIFIRNDLHINHERFYLRHELGHAILHPEILCSYSTDLIPYGKLEKEANYFAFKLSGITFRKEELRDMSLSQVASILEFPEAVLRNIIPERIAYYGS